MWRWLGIVCWLAATAHADTDGRPADRFYFGVYGAATNGGGAGGYEVSAWPNEYIGIMAGTSITTAGQIDSTASSTTFDWGASVVASVPLRYVQPYAGGWIGFARTAVDGEGTGFHTDLQPVLGLNTYVSRNLRLYVQWRTVTVHKGMDGVSDPTTDVFALGVRWSPDAFRRARAANKIDLVWGSVTFSGILWLLINGFQAGSGSSNKSSGGHPSGMMP